MPLPTFPGGSFFGLVPGNLQLCGPRHDPQHHTKARGVHGCNVINSHNAEWRTVHSSVGIEHFFSQTLPESLSVAIFRDPRERLLSRYYYDMMKGKIYRGTPAASVNTSKLGTVSAPEPSGGSWLSTVEVGRLMAWIKSKGIEGHHYGTALPLKMHNGASAEELQEAVGRFEVVGVTERIPELVAMIALSLNCDGASWAYTSLKRVVGRPTFADLPSHTQTEIVKVTSTAYGTDGLDGAPGGSRVGTIDGSDRREPVTDFAIWRAAEKIARSREAAAGAAFVKTLDSLHNGMAEKSSDRLLGPIALDPNCVPDPDHRKHTWHGFDCVSILPRGGNGPPDGGRGRGAGEIQQKQQPPEHTTSSSRAPITLPAEVEQ